MFKSTVRQKSRSVRNDISFKIPLPGADTGFPEGGGGGLVMAATSSPCSVSNENRFQFLVYRESKITCHIPDKQLKLSQKHKCGDFMWLNTVMSSCV